MRSTSPLRASMMALLVVTILYPLLCADVLSSLGVFPLATTRYVDKSSPTYPFQFPIPNFLIDGYWKFHGEEKLRNKNLESNKLVLFIVESIDYHKRNKYPYNQVAAQSLLDRYVCERVKRGLDVTELRTYADRFESIPLATALSSCKQERNPHKAG